MIASGSVPLISVIILNFNGAKWIARCLDSLKAQTILSQLEIIVADNHSTDGSDKLAEELIQPWQNGVFTQHGENLDFCEGNNRAALSAKGDYLFFLNNDTWLEPDCLQKLLTDVKAAGARAGTPLMLNYDDDSFQAAGGAGFDVFGLLSPELPLTESRKIFVAGGCCYLIERTLFESVGQFDSEFYLYADEYDISWRMWIAGASAIIVPAAKLHH